MDRLGVFGRWFGSGGHYGGGSRRHRRRVGARRRPASADGADGIAEMLSCLTQQARQPGRAEPAAPVPEPAEPPPSGVGLWPPALVGERARAPVVWTVRGNEVTYTMVPQDLVHAAVP